MKIYQGSCHCGAVTFTIEADIQKVMECNCSHCYRKGLLLSFVPGEQFILKTGAENLTDYLFNKKRIHHLFCKTCGVQPFGRAAGSNGEETVAVNVRTLPDLDISTLAVDKVDGKKY